MQVVNSIDNHNASLSEGDRLAAMAGALKDQVDRLENQVSRLNCQTSVLVTVVVEMTKGQKKILDLLTSISKRDRTTKEGGAVKPHVKLFLAPWCVEWALAVAVVSSLLLGQTARAEESRPRRQRGNLEAFPAGVAEERVAGHPRVVDGDTLDFQGVHVRLEGIDAPEYRQYCRDTDGTCYPCGWFSTKALELLVGKAKVECKLSEKDRYGRWLGTCYAKGRNLNGALVEGGFAFAYRRYSERYVPQEDEARREKRALWGVKAVGPWDWRKGERLPECRSPANRIPIEAYRLKADP